MHSATNNFACGSTKHLVSTLSLFKCKSLKKQKSTTSGLVTPLLKLSVQPSVIPSSISQVPPLYTYIQTTPGFHDSDVLLDIDTPTDNISTVEKATTKPPADVAKQVIEHAQGLS